MKFAVNASTAEGVARSCAAWFANPAVDSLADYIAYYFTEAVLTKIKEVTEFIMGALWYRCRPYN